MKTRMRSARGQATKLESKVRRYLANPTLITQIPNPVDPGATQDKYQGRRTPPEGYTGPLPENACLRRRNPGTKGKPVVKAEVAS